MYTDILQFQAILISITSSVFLTQGGGEIQQFFQYNYDKVVAGIELKKK